MNMNKEALFIYEEDGFCELKYTYGDLCKLFVENTQLKEQLEKKYEKIGTLTSEILYEENTKLQSVLKELRSWLEDEKDRLARECSQIYEDSLGKTRLVNEDIFNEVNKILSKLNELEGKNE